MVSHCNCCKYNAVSELRDEEQPCMVHSRARVPHRMRQRSRRLMPTKAKPTATNLRSHDKAGLHRRISHQPHGKDQHKKSRSIRPRLPPTMSSAAPTPEVVRKYNELIQETNRLAQKIAELEFDKNEHRLVEETLKPLDGKRRAYRLVGEVLVERTVDEVLPSVSGNREKVSVSFLKQATETVTTTAISAHHCLYGCSSSLTTGMVCCSFIAGSHNCLATVPPRCKEQGSHGAQDKVQSTDGRRALKCIYKVSFLILSG